MSFQLTKLAPLPSAVTCFPDASSQGNVISIRMMRWCTFCLCFLHRLATLRAGATAMALADFTGVTAQLQPLLSTDGLVLPVQASARRMWPLSTRCTTSWSTWPLMPR